MEFVGTYGEYPVKTVLLIMQDAAMTDQDKQIKGLTGSKIDKQGTTTIVLPRRFDISVRQAFSGSYKHIMTPEMRYVVDLAETEFIDIFALGMLLLLRDHAIRNKGSVVIANCNTAVREFLEIVKFDLLFEIP